MECEGELPTPSFKVLGNSLLSQIHIHKEYGGVYPMLAKREHQKNLPILLEQTLKEANLSEDQFDEIDYIAVTAGPGLEPALWAGISFAEELGKKWNKPIIAANHMEGHLFSFLFIKDKPLEFPAIGLLVSGGHTELIDIESFSQYKILGKTRDDAVGEAFDKTARLLGLPYPGGPKISALASISRDRGDEDEFKFTRPMLGSDDFDFSYSGLKTAVLYKTKDLGELDDKTREKLARAFEDAAIEPLIKKTRIACEEKGAKSLIVGGGVSANKYLRENLISLSEELALDLRLPPMELSTDNAVMIGIAAYVNLKTQKAKIPETLKAQGNLLLG